MHDREILFLDEPTSGVDPLARRQFWRLIEERARAGAAVVITTHYLYPRERKPDRRSVRFDLRSNK